MTFVFPDANEIRATFGGTLRNEEFGNPAIAGRVEMTATMYKVRQWSQQSKTAQQIIKYVEESSKPVYLVGMKGGGNTAFSSDDPAPGRGVVYFNFDARFQTKQGVGGLAQLHQYIAFLHELGHAKQWIENPAFFDGTAMNTRKFASDIQAAAKNMHMKINHVNYGQAGRNLQHTALRMTRPAWSVRVEMDNLVRHEWPICDESKTKRRLGYTDLVMS